MLRTHPATSILYPKRASPPARTSLTLRRPLRNLGSGRMGEASSAPAEAQDAAGTPGYPSTVVGTTSAPAPDEATGVAAVVDTARFPPTIAVTSPVSSGPRQDENAGIARQVRNHRRKDGTLRCAGSASMALPGPTTGERTQHRAISARVGRSPTRNVWLSTVASRTDTMCTSSCVASACA